jgi:hypothetical protein
MLNLPHNNEQFSLQLARTMSKCGRFVKMLKSIKTFPFIAKSRVSVP